MKLKELLTNDDRNPEIYLGIDGKGIPKEMFEYDELFDCGFYVFESSDLRTTEGYFVYEKDSFFLISYKDNAYILKEDIVSKLVHHATSNCFHHEEFIKTEKWKNTTNW